MTGRHPARVLAPLALVVTALALLIVVVSGGGEEETFTAPAPVATVTPTPTPTPTPEDAEESYTVVAGDTPALIAEREGIELEDLLEANPDINPAGLSVGQELTIP